MHVLIKRINKFKLKLKYKPWITLGLQKSIFVKSKLLTVQISLIRKVPILKEEFHTDTQKGIKFLISLKTLGYSVPNVLSLDNSDNVTNPYDIANTNTLLSIYCRAETTKKHEVFM